MIEEMNLERWETRVVLRIPMKLKKRGGRKEVIIPDALQERVSKAEYDEPFAIAIARAMASSNCSIPPNTVYS